MVGTIGWIYVISDEARGGALTYIPTMMRSCSSKKKTRERVSFSGIYIGTVRVDRVYDINFMKFGEKGYTFQQ